MTWRLCVAFDLDDTLYKERDFVMSGRSAVAEAFSSKAGKSSEKLNMLMNAADNAFDSLLALPGIKTNNIGIQEILQVYRCHEPELTLPEESRDVLHRLCKDNVYIGIITDGRRLTQWNKIKALGLDKIVAQQNIVVSEEFGADKKSPKPFEYMMEHCPAEKYVYVGDNPAKDFFQARKLGWTTVMLRDNDGVNVHSQNLNDISVEFQPDYIIDNISDLTNKIIPCLQH